MSKRVNRDPLATINDYSLTASYAWWRMEFICEIFFTWCVEQSITPPLEGTYYWKGNKEITSSRLDLKTQMVLQ